jgi:succinoglycan biosynthesis transport protein ExoP
MAQNLNRGAAQGSSFSMGDIWYALFRHKWKVIGFAVIGVLAAGVVFTRNVPLYVSEAKLLLRYIVDTRTVEVLGSEGQVRTTPSGISGSILNSEAEIIQSFDLCQQVAQDIGPARILRGLDTPGTNLLQAAGRLRSGVKVEVGKQSNVIKVTVAHSDPEIAQRALQKLIEFYYKRHNEIHRGVGTMEPALERQTLQLRQRLADTDQEIRKLRTDAGIVSLEETKLGHAQQMGAIRQMMLMAEAELTEHLLLDPNSSTNSATNLLAAAMAPVTNAVAAAAAVTNAPAASPDAALVGQYRTILFRLESLNRQELDLRGVYTEGSRMMVRLREQITEAQGARETLEKQHPSLAAMLEPVKAATPGEVVVRKFDPDRVRALQGKLIVLRQKLEKLAKEGAAIEEFETRLTELLRRREMDDKNFRHFTISMEQNRFNTALDSGKLANISVVQEPTPASLDSEKRNKMAAMALFGGVAFGIGLALLIEFMLDLTVRRYNQLETNHALPMLSTIPKVRLKAKRLAGRNGKAVVVAGSTNAEGRKTLDWEPDHPLREAIDAIRDRTMMHFDGDLRKPKLIGVTGCRTGSGVTTVASSLAAALSETGEGQVLLVNLASGSKTAHPFSFGRPLCSLSEAVEAGSKSTALIANNLYAANGNGNGNGNGKGDNSSEKNGVLPTTLSRILPKIKMSDYDYVVFDMPPVSPTSITSKLAGMIDLVFMVAESERDSQNAVKRASRILGENNATFRIILNKFRPYVPKWLDHD